MLLQIMTVGEQCPAVDELMDNPFDKYITITTNYCGYSGLVEELIVNYVHPFFLRVSQPQVETKIQIGVRPQLEYLLKVIGKQ